MKHLLITTIAAVVLVGCGPSVDIHQAAKDGNIKVVKQHLDAGTDVDAKDTNGWTPLHLAALNGQKETTEILIAEGADVNTGDKITPLHYAAQYGEMEIVELLISKGADVNAKGDAGDTPLDWAIQLKRTEISDLLRKHGGKSGAEDSVHVAAAVGNIEAVKKHLAAGADVNAKNEDGGTPLLRAAWGGHKEIAELLIANGADVNVKSGRTATPPLHLAAYKGHKEVVELVIAKGADVNAKGDAGDTPLDWAISRKRTETADLLRKHGAMTGFNQSFVK